MDSKEPGKIKKKVAVYNMIPNMVWSVICLPPISVFCYTNMEVKWFCIFLAISILSVFLPVSFFNFLQIGKTISVYKKTGVIFINKFTQNGDIINKMMRRKYPGYKMVSKRNLSMNKLIDQTYMLEKFHFMLFSVFTLTTVYAVLHQFYCWAFFITITNLVYNVYPILLQQYIRLRISLFKMN